MVSWQKIRSMHPFQFSSPNLAIGPLLGWLPFFSRLCSDIENLQKGGENLICWTQVKEKTGSLRARFRVMPLLEEREWQNLRNAAFELCERALNESMTTCEICSAPVEPGLEPTGHMVLCRQHSMARQRDGAAFDEMVRGLVQAEVQQLRQAGFLGYELSGPPILPPPHTEQIS